MEYDKLSENVGRDYREASKISSNDPKQFSDLNGKWRWTGINEGSRIVNEKFEVDVLIFF